MTWTPGPCEGEGTRAGEKQESREARPPNYTQANHDIRGSLAVSTDSSTATPDRVVFIPAHYDSTLHKSHSHFLANFMAEG